MARSRNIKPGFFKNERLADISGMAGRVLFAGLWTLADREGRLEDRPRYIKAEIFPYDEGVDVDGLLVQLDRSGFIQRYAVSGEGYIAITKWHKHQNPHVKEAASTIPPPLEHQTSTMQEQCNPDTSMEVAVLIPDSLNLIPDSLNLIPDIAPSADGPPTEKPTKPLRAEKEANTDPFTYSQVIAKAAGYPKYDNKSEACKHALTAIKMGVTCEELAGCVGYMLETNGAFWANQTLSIPSAIRQLPAYRKALANNWKPGDGAIQKGQSNGYERRSTGRSRTPEVSAGGDPYAATKALLGTRSG